MRQVRRTFVGLSHWRAKALVHASCHNSAHGLLQLSPGQGAEEDYWVMSCNEYRTEWHAARSTADLLHEHEHVRPRSVSVASQQTALARQSTSPSEWSTSCLLYNRSSSGVSYRLLRPDLHCCWSPPCYTRRVRCSTFDRLSLLRFCWSHSLRLLFTAWQSAQSCWARPVSRNLKTHVYLLLALRFIDSTLEVFFYVFALYKYIYLSYFTYCACCYLTTDAHGGLAANAAT